MDFLLCHPLLLINFRKVLLGIFNILISIVIFNRLVRFEYCLHCIFNNIKKIDKLVIIESLFVYIYIHWNIEFTRKDKIN